MSVVEFGPEAAKRTNKNDRWTPAEMLRDAAKAADEGLTEKALLLMVTGRDGEEMRVTHITVGLKQEEAVYMLHCALSDYVKPPER